MRPTRGPSPGPPTLLPVSLQRIPSAGTRETRSPSWMRWALNRQLSRQTRASAILTCFFLFVLEPSRLLLSFLFPHPTQSSMYSFVKMQMEVWSLGVYVNREKNGKKGRGVGFLGVPMTAAWTLHPLMQAWVKGQLTELHSHPLLCSKRHILEKLYQMERWSMRWCWRFHGPRCPFRPGALTGCLLCSGALLVAQIGKRIHLQSLRET